jgi:hypothetical protein
MTRFQGLHLDRWPINRFCFLHGRIEMGYPSSKLLSRTAATSHEPHWNFMKTYVHRNVIMFPTLHVMNLTFCRTWFWTHTLVPRYDHLAASWLQKRSDPQRSLASHIGELQAGSCRQVHIIISIIIIELYSLCVFVFVCLCACVPVYRTSFCVRGVAQTQGRHRDTHRIERGAKKRSETLLSQSPRLSPRSMHTARHKNAYTTCKHYFCFYLFLDIVRSQPLTFSKWRDSKNFIQENEMRE